MALANKSVGVATRLLIAATATGAGGAKRSRSPRHTFQVTGFVTASTGAAGVDVEVSNDGVNWVVLISLVLTLGVAVTTDTDVSDAPWKFVRGNVTSISGTNAQVTLWIGG